jgi:hypothetical protein
MRRIVPILIVGAVVVVGAACDDPATTATIAEAGSEDAPPDHTTAEAGPAVADAADALDGAPSCALPGVYGSKACQACLQTSCCGPITACESDAACKPLQKCMLDCLPAPDAGGCASDCMAAHGAGLSGWKAVEACWFNFDTPTSCGLSCT